MGVYNRLYTVKFKDAEFFWDESTTNSGRRWVIHEFPNKDNVDPENLGLNTDQFTIRGVIGDPFYEEKKAALVKALNDDTPGILVHPFKGRVRCVALPYKITENRTNTGEAIFDMVFKQTKPETFPQKTGSNKSIVNKLYEDIYNLAKDQLKLETLLNYLNNILAEAQRIQRMLAILAEANDILQSFGSNNSDFESSSRKLSESVYKVSQSADDIGDSVTGVTQDFDNSAIESGPDNRLAANLGSFGLGLDDEPIKTNTQALIERNHNNKAYNGAYNAMILANLYDTAGNLEYADESQLDATINSIETNYNSFVSSENVFMSQELSDKVDAIRNESFAFFETLRPTLKRIITVRTDPTPLPVFVYRYYGSLDNYDEILGLNNIFNPERISGDIKIVTEQ